MHFQIFGNNDGNIIHVFKNCIFISVATVLEVSKMTVPICTSHWCLVMSFWLKVCIYSHTRGVKLGLELGFMQTSQVQVSSVEYKRWMVTRTCQALKVTKSKIKGIVHSKMQLLLNIYSHSGHPRCRWVCFFIKTDLEKFCITSQWMGAVRMKV